MGFTVYSMHSPIHPPIAKGYQFVHSISSLVFNIYMQRVPDMICLFRLDKLVDDTVEEDTSNTNRATQKLDGVEGFSQNKGNTDDDNHTLGSVGNTLGYGSSLLQCHGSNLIVSVEPETGSDQVLPHGRRSLDKLDKFSHTASLLQENERNTEDESHDRGDGKLVTNASNTILESWSFHDLFVFVTLDSGKSVGNAGRDESRPGEIKFLHRGKDDSSNDNGQTHPLGFRDFLVVDVSGKDGSEGGLGSFDDLCKRDGSHSHGEHTGRVGTHEAETDGDELHKIILGNLRLLTSIGGKPQEDSVKRTNGELKTRQGHRKSNLSSSGVEGQLVGNVVLQKK